MLSPNVTYQPKRVTFYGFFGDIGGAPKCDQGDGFGPVNRLYFAAVALSEFKPSACGQCVRVSANNRSVVVPIVDSCDACTGSDLDLSQTAFGDLVGGFTSAPEIGVISDAVYQLVPCGDHGAKTGALPDWYKPSLSGADTVNVGLIAGVSVAVAVVLALAAICAFRHRSYLKRVVRNMS
ncbi:hypothetical protein HDU78_002731 [Chytriomyces hyalinus]|nr:hypothetical protein HDU78_002731 [Chytriomyces hyalinus]